MAAKPAAKEKSSTKVITTPTGIVCFANVFDAKRFKPDQDAKYGLILVFNKKELERKPAQASAWQAMRAAVGAAATAKFGDDAKRLLARGKLSLPWREGTEYEEYGEPFSDETIFVRASSTRAPGIVSPALRPILSDEEFYSGCIARFTAGVWPFDNSGNKGVTLLLNNIQKVADGERLAGSKRAAEEDFDALEEAEEGDDDLLG